MIGLTIYIIGVVVALIQLLFLASYFDKNGETIEQLSAATCVCIASWFTVLILCISYKKQFIEMFKRNDNTKV
jgi:hypothetical protein